MLRSYTIEEVQGTRARCVVQRSMLASLGAEERAGLKPRRCVRVCLISVGQVKTPSCRFDRNSTELAKVSRGVEAISKHEVCGHAQHTCAQRTFARGSNFVDCIAVPIGKTRWRVLPPIPCLPTVVLLLLALICPTAHASHNTHAAHYGVFQCSSLDIAHVLVPRMPRCPHAVCALDEAPRL